MQQNFTSIHPTELFDTDFEQFITDPKHDIVLVDVWAPWCAPCRSMEPTIDELARKYHGTNVFITKLNADENHQVLATYGVQSLPNFLFFRGGKFRDRRTGSVSKDVLEKAISSLSSW